MVSISSTGNTAHGGMKVKEFGTFFTQLQSQNSKLNSRHLIWISCYVKDTDTMCVRDCLGCEVNP